MYVDITSAKLLTALKGLVETLDNYSMEDDYEFNTAYDSILFTDGVGTQANKGSNDSITYKEFKTLYGTD